MPNRILRDGILESQRVNLLSDEEEVFYRRLMSIVDDYGCYEARPALLRARLYPLKLDSKSEARVAEMLNALAAAKLIFPYVVQGKPILQLLDFNQQTRSSRKHPQAPAKHLLAFTSSQFCLASAEHPLAIAHLVVVVCEVVCVCVDVVEDVVVAAAPPAAVAQQLTTDSPKERKPKSLKSVIAYAAALSISEEEARRFFDYNEARKWKLPPGAAGWAQLLSLWIERKEQRAISSGSPRKKSSGARSSESTPFDPTKPHAHTGGLPVVN